MFAADTGRPNRVLKDSARSVDPAPPRFHTMQIERTTSRLQESVRLRTRNLHPDLPGPARPARLTKQTRRQGARTALGRPEEVPATGATRSMLDRP